jgi:hypothetical protein
MATFAEVFPPVDPVARFIVAMAIAKNDIRFVLRHAGAAVDQDAPEQGYLIRLATSHFYEAERALRAWSGDPAVKRFLDGLPDDAKQARKTVFSTVGKLGGGAALERLRNHTLHYPYPNHYGTDEDLQKALRALATEEVTLVTGVVQGVRFGFADDAALTMAYAKHDHSKLREQLYITRDGTVALVNVVTRAWERYVEIHGLELGHPASN